MARDARRHRLVHLVDAAIAVALATAVASPAFARPVNFSVALGAKARPGAGVSVTIRTSVAPDLPPVTQLRLLTPAGIDLTSTGLGAVECRRPASEIAAVMTPVDHDPCPANSLMGVGSAVADILLERRAGGAAQLSLHAGASVADKPGLVVIADTYNPARFHLTYQGFLYVPPPGFGVGVAILIPQIPTLPFGAPIALSRLRLTIGGDAIVYTHRVHGQVTRYHPSGVTLPRCSRDGLRFRLILRFADGSRRSNDAEASCPAGRRPLSGSHPS